MPTVLIVDDSLTDRRLICDLLRRQSDWKIEQAASGMEALARLQHAKPDVLVTDLPEHDDDWDEEEHGSDGAYLTVEEETIENQPKNKARVFRIRSLDQMVDESDRLARAVYDGDVLKWIERDEGAVFKVRLLLRQLESLTRALREIARQHNLPLDEDE